MGLITGIRCNDKAGLRGSTYHKGCETLKETEGTLGLG